MQIYVKLFKINKNYLKKILTTSLAQKIKNNLREHRVKK
jgi:hypothetical protein